VYLSELSVTYTASDVLDDLYTPDFLPSIYPVDNVISAPLTFIPVIATASISLNANPALPSLYTI
jgi:hypothetical protein